MNRLISLSLTQLFAQFARVGRLGRWIDVDNYRTELDVGSMLIVLSRGYGVPMENAEWTWVVYDSASLQRRMESTDIASKGASSKEEAKVLATAALSARCADICKTYGVTRGLIDLATVRLDAEQEGKPIP